MAGSSPSPAPATTIADLDENSLSHCAAHLNVRDLSNLAMTCTSLKRLAYSDSIWLRFFREHWHQEIPCSSLNLNGARDFYLARRTALQQFKFLDPLVVDVYRTGRPPVNHLILHKNQLFFTQGSLLETIDLDKYQKGATGVVNTFGDHTARISCLRLFSVNEIPLSRGKTEREQDLLVTSSFDHSIRLWQKSFCLRCLRGHNGPVLSLSNKLLGDDSCKILASGGEDGTVRLWSLSSSGKRGQRALKATLYGHEKPVDLMSVAGHKTSLLVTISRDAKVRVWDTAASSSAARSSCCVGMTSVANAPVNMKCHESLLYVAAGSSVTAIDLRTMQKVITAAVNQPKLYSFDIGPSTSLICTGAYHRAMLWDVRKNQEVLKPEPVVEMDGHCGPVTLLQMDPYKVVTGGPDDAYVNVWEVDTGAHTNSLVCSDDEKDGTRFGCDAMAVDGFRIATASSCEGLDILRFRDFNNASSPAAKLENNCPTSKFWDSLSSDDSDSDDDR